MLSNMYSAGLLALAAGAVLAANNATSEALKAGCGVDFEPPPEAMSIFQELSTSANASLEARADAFEPVTVNVNLHVVTGVESEQKDYPEQQLIEQISVLNKAFASDKMTFKIAKINRVWDEKWVVNEDEDNMIKKTRPRQGKADTMNVWLMGAVLSKHDGSSRVGRATLPWNYQKSPDVDGVFIVQGTIPGGYAKPYNGGKTLVHEVGHWLGLMHTFEKGCEYDGDHIPDTAMHTSATQDCESLDLRSDCPNEKRPQPANNLMNYGEDHCMTEFSPKQREAMRMFWNQFRAPKQNDKKPPVASPKPEAPKKPGQKPGDTPTTPPAPPPKNPQEPPAKEDPATAWLRKCAQAFLPAYNECKKQNCKDLAKIRQDTKTCAAAVGAGNPDQALPTGRECAQLLAPGARLCGTSKECLEEAKRQIFSLCPREGAAAAAAPEGGSGGSKPKPPPPPPSPQRPQRPQQPPSRPQRPAPPPQPKPEEPENNGGGFSFGD